MENKHVGYLILGISALIIFIIFLFNNAMRNIILEGCPMAHDTGICPSLNTVTQQTYLSLAIVGILMLIGLILVLSKPKEKIVYKTIKENKPKKEINLSQFKPEEKQVLKIMQEESTIFQADLIEKTGFGKAKVSRILDRLEDRGIIERKRRGMTNVVVLKN